jgi:hypothetical protein
MTRRQAQSSVWALKKACLQPPGWYSCNFVETEYLVWLVGPDAILEPVRR